MTWVAVAIGGAALIGAVASSNAASSAAGAQRDAANQATATSQGQYNQTRQDQLPWMNRGNAAGNQLAYLMGLPGYGPQMGVGGNSGYGGGAGSGGGTGYGGGSSPNVAGDGGGGRSNYGGNGRAQGPLMATSMVGGTGKGIPSYSMVNNDQAFLPTENSIGFTGNGAGTGAGNGQQAPVGNPGIMQDGSQYNPSMGGYGSLTQAFGADQFRVDPGYQFRLAEGAKALERSAAAKGMSLSGAQLKGLSQYNQGFASNEYGNAYNRYNNDQTNLFNRLSGIAGTGQQANQFVGQMGAQNAYNIGQNQIGAGNATASGYIGQANAWTNAMNQGANAWMTYNAMKK